MTCRIAPDESNTSPEIIQVVNVAKSYGGQRILHDVTFSIKKSHIAAIVGGSGQGKSVLMRIIIGLEKPDSGAVLVNGEDLVTMSRKNLNRVRRNFGVLFQDSALFDYLTVGENIAFPMREHLRLKEREIHDLVEAKLADVGLEGQSPKMISELSGGMRKRVGLARALALDPEIVFFDEPTTGLDPVSAGQIYDLIMNTCNARPVTYVMVTHDIQRILPFTDDVIMIHEGTIVAQDTAHSISSNPEHIVSKFMTGKYQEFGYAH